MVRRLCALAFVGVLVVALGVGVPEAAGADPAPVTFTVDSATAHPGDTVTITATFTNPETVPVVFGYMSIFATWETQINGTQWEFNGCSGEISWCWSYAPYPRGAAWHPTAPIAPGASRTVTLTYQVRTDSQCGPGEDISFLFYSYRETAGGTADITVPGPTTNVVC